MAATIAAWKRWLWVVLAIATPSLVMTIGMAMPSQYKLGFFLRMTGGPWEPVVSQPAVLVGWLWAVLITLLAFAHPIFARSEMITVSVLGIAWWLIAGFVLATGGY